MTEEAMSKYQFILSSGPEHPVKATRSMMFACRAVEEGHQVSIFLVDDAVYLSNLALSANIRASTGDDLMTYLKVILDAKIPVMVCLPCVKARNISEKDIPQGWTIEKGVEAIRLSEQGYITWTF
jgi:sulfur relay (sulfurtransferase) complex TusBCD TusD component (DsrE family)